MTDSKSQAVLSLLKTYLNDETAEILLTPIMSGCPVLIEGKQGPTGKTTLCHELEKLGIVVTERWMLDCPFPYCPVPEVFKKLNKGNDNKAFVTIALNEFVC